MIYSQAQHAKLNAVAVEYVQGAGKWFHETTVKMAAALGDQTEKTKEATFETGNYGMVTKAAAEAADKADKAAGSMARTLGVDVPKGAARAADAVDAVSFSISRAIDVYHGLEAATGDIFASTRGGKEVGKTVYGYNPAPMLGDNPIPSYDELLHGSGGVDLSPEAFGEAGLGGGLVNQGAIFGGSADAGAAALASAFGGVAKAQTAVIKNNLAIGATLRDAVAASGSLTGAYRAAEKGDYAFAKAKMDGRLV
jgi:hypothetical protein